MLKKGMGEMGVGKTNRARLKVEQSGVKHGARQMTSSEGENEGEMRVESKDQEI